VASRALQQAPERKEAMRQDYLRRELVAALSEEALELDERRPGIDAGVILENYIATPQFDGELVATAMRRVQQLHRADPARAVNDIGIRVIAEAVVEFRRAVTQRAP
jgi:hypothetical protein